MRGVGTSRAGLCRAVGHPEWVQDPRFVDAAARRANVREMIGEAVPPAFTKLHGEVLQGILKREWARAPMASSDERITKGWTKLAAAAKKDGRQDPRDYFDYAKPAGRAVPSNKRSGSSTVATRA